MLNNNCKVIIDSSFSYLYSSFYMFGLIEVFGWEKISFSHKHFKNLPDPGWNMRFIILENDKEIRYFIHTNDTYHIDKTNYEWCDIYGHVNANFTYYPKEEYPKIVSLVPSFGIRVLSLPRTMLLAVICFVKSFNCVINRVEWNKFKKSHEVNKLKNIKHFFMRFYKCYKNRLPYAEYEKFFSTENNYIFFLSTLWYNHPDNQNDERVNLRRAHFIRSCKKINNIEFVGGLLPDTSSSKEKFTDVLANQGCSMKDWLYNTKRSAIVFNTPAFWDCHGWKLGEYLALGKCIVSTKLSNDLPYPLEHGVNIHFVENTEDSMKEAIEYILSHPEYRHKLEQGAKAYWNKYGMPIASLKLLGIIKK